MSTKLCPKCNETKSYDEFYKNRTKPDGCSVYCRACVIKWYYDEEADRRREVRRARPVEVRKLGRGTLAEGGKKCCGSCGEEKEATREFFSNNKKFSDGLEPTCKLCRRQSRWKKREQYIEYHRQYLAGHQDKVQAWRTKIRAEMVAAYGSKCECCGETEPEFLTLDHKGGKTEKNHPWNSNLSGSKIYGKLKKLGWPKDLYRLLCWNCNCASRWTGVCPHERGRALENGNSLRTPD